MKLVVDISENTRKRCRRICLNPVDFAIRDGKPFSDVLDEITAEIIEMRSRQNVGVLECLDIIDKCKEGVSE